MGRCSICGTETDLCCSDCGIESSGEKTVYVCSRAECRDEHERLNPQHPLAHRPTIDEIEALLNSDTDIELDILPNGEVRASKSKERVGSFKVLTMREKLGGEYGGRLVYDKARGIVRDGKPLGIFIEDTVLA